MAIFVVFGALGGNWDSRLPAIRHRLGLDSGELGVVIFAVALASTAALPVAGWFSSRLGSRGPSVFGLLCAGAGISAAAFVPSYGTLLPVACVIGAGWGITDVAANAHGVALEQALGRRVLSGLHSAWSFGLLAGSGIAAGAAAAGIGLRVQFPVVAAAAALALVLAAPFLLPATGAALDSARFALPRGPLALPALLMFCGFFVEAATISWAAVFLTGPVGTSSAVAAGGVAAFSLAMGLARLVGDPLLERWGSAAWRFGAALSRVPASRWLWPRALRFLRTSASPASAPPRRPSCPRSSAWAGPSPASHRAPGSPRSRRPATPAGSSTARRSASSPAASA